MNKNKRETKMITDQAFIVPNAKKDIHLELNKNQDTRNSIRFDLINFLMNNSAAYKRLNKRTK